MIFVIDASVAIKSFVNESGWEPVRAWLDWAHMLVAPDRLRIALANIIWTKQQRRDKRPRQALEITARLDDQFDWFETCQAHRPAALRLAGDQLPPVYDCTYPAAADTRGASVATAPTALPDIERPGVLINTIFAGLSGLPGNRSKGDASLAGGPADRRLSGGDEPLSDTDRLSFVLARPFGIGPRQPFGHALMNARAIPAGADFDPARYLARDVTVISAGFQSLIGALRARPSTQ